MDNTNQGNPIGSPPKAKKSKLNEEEQQEEEVEEEQPKKIHDLDYDCFEQMYKWLSMKDLLNIRLTSKTLKNQADTYIEATYQKNFTFGYGRITIYDSNDIDRVCRLEPKLTDQIKMITHWFEATTHQRQI